MENKRKIKLKKEAYEKEKFEEEIVQEVNEDFARRREERKSLEKQWELNLDFLKGKQYSYINSRGEILSEDKEFFWQNMDVFNHIAPLIEARLAKLTRIEPIMSVRPASDEDKDVSNAIAAEKVLESTFKKLDMKKIISNAAAWSECTGTAFYKIMWDNDGGHAVGEMSGAEIHEGEVSVLALSPFEIFPDRLSAEDIENCKSIIQAKVLPAAEIFSKYGVKLEGSEIDVIDFSAESSLKDSSKTDRVTEKNSLIVIEKYEKPTKQFPRGRLVITAGNKLLYYGDLPYKNGANGSRDYPFVKQTSIRLAGNFFGQSVVERLIPTQRAYNAVKNRKHEFINRLTMGVMTAEDGSIDTDDLSIEGLSPGKVLVYRQGTNPPKMLSETGVPDSFSEEENKLLNEFITISGVSDVSSSSANATVSSGSALQLLVEQDNERMTVVAEEIRRCYQTIGAQILRLYKEFLVGSKACKYCDDDAKSKIFYVDKSALNSDDVSIENENELLYTENQKKDMLFKLYSSGILSDSDGEILAETKEKVLSLLGYKNLAAGKGLIKLDQQKAQDENQRLRTKTLEVEIIDDDRIHIIEHTRYALSEYDSLSGKERANIFEHISRHKSRLEENTIKKQE